MFIGATASAAAAESITILTLDRVNFYSSNRLVFDLRVDSNCRIHPEAPLDVYYIDKATGRRLLEFTNASRDYFGPRLNSSDIGVDMVNLRFRALSEVQRAIGPVQLIARVTTAGGRCFVRAEISYEGNSFVLEHIDLSLRVVFGVPTGVDWVLLSGQDYRGPLETCVIGDCRSR